MNVFRTTIVWTLLTPIYLNISRSLPTRWRFFYRNQYQVRIYLLKLPLYVTIANTLRNSWMIFHDSISWWRHQIETFSALLAICAGNSPVPGEFPTQRPVTRSFDVYFDLRPINGWVNNREAGDLRRHRAHYDVIVMCHKIRAVGNSSYSKWFKTLKFRDESNRRIPCAYTWPTHGSHHLIWRFSTHRAPI